MKSRIIITLFALTLAAVNVQAQKASKTAAAKQQPENKVAYTETDGKFGNTTIVYTKGVAKDADVLNEMNKSFGMGDVVRIAVAPPKPTTPPVAKLAPKSGIAAKSVNVSAPEINKVSLIGAQKSEEAEEVPEPAYAAVTFPVNSDTQNLTAGTDFDFVAAGHVAPAPVQSLEAEKARLNTAENVVTEAAAAPKAAKTLSKSSSSKSKVSKGSKSAKKKSTPSKRNKRKGKQRYGCFKF